MAILRLQSVLNCFGHGVLECWSVEKNDLFLYPLLQNSSVVGWVERSETQHQTYWWIQIFE
jgi:hypothetical protein